MLRDDYGLDPFVLFGPGEGTVLGDAIKWLGDRAGLHRMLDDWDFQNCGGLGGRMWSAYLRHSFERIPWPAEKMVLQGVGHPIQRGAANNPQINSNAVLLGVAIVLSPGAQSDGCRLVSHGG